jgi:Tol biopolymer transport system component
MFSGVVQPGGEWLAYAAGTSQGSTPGTVYLLNLRNNKHLKLSVPSGEAETVLNWSPDGKWFYMVGTLNHALQGFVVSANGTHQTVVTPPGYSGFDAAWSPDSKFVAFTVQFGGAEEPGATPEPYRSELYIVDVESNKYRLVTTANLALESGALFMQPSWSPDGSTLALMSYNPSCPGLCSQASPAAYVIALQPAAKK